MRRNPPCRGKMVGLLVGCMLLVFAVASVATVAAGGDYIARAAKRGKLGKIIAAPRFEVPEHILAPPRPPGSPTVTFVIAGRLVMRGCFTSASSNGRKVKCSGPVLKECVNGRAIEVHAPFALIPTQFVSAGADGSFTATVESEGNYQELFLKVGAKRAQSGGLRIICYPESFPVDISEAPPG